MNTPAPTDLMTAKQVAAYLQRSYPRTIPLIGGEIPATRVGGQWRVRRADVDAYLAARLTTAKVRPRRARGKRASP